jgi:hypothetical protein
MLLVERGEETGKTLLRTLSINGKGKVKVKRCEGEEVWLHRFVTSAPDGSFTLRPLHTCERVTGMPTEHRARRGDKHKNPYH